MPFARSAADLGFRLPALRQSIYFIDLILRRLIPPLRLPFSPQVLEKVGADLTETGIRRYI